MASPSDRASERVPERVLVTGAAGFLGGWLCRRLVEDGHVVAGLVRAGLRNDGRLARLGLLDRMEVWAGSAERTRRLAGFAPTAVVNLAGQSQIAAARADPAAAFRDNTAFTWELLDELRGLDSPPAVIHASTEAVYGSSAGARFRERDPLSPLAPYAASKAAAEVVLRAYGETYGIPVVILRFGNLYGPGDPNSARLIPDLVRAFTAARPARLREGGATRTYLHVDDAVEAVVRVLARARDADVRGETFNVAGNHPYTNLEVARLARHAAGRDGLDIVVGDATGGSVQCASTEKVERVIDWHPRVALADGLRQVALEGTAP